jgi:AcrR family transcriptional regulator
LVADTRTRSRLTGSERRRRILEAAIEAFAARGYEGASMREIATAAGVTKPVLYDHFASKERLFVEAMESIRDELTRRGAEAMGRRGALEARVRAAISAFFSYVEEKPAAARVLLVAPRGRPELIQASRRVQAEATARLAALLAREPELLRGVRGRARRLELTTEFIRQGLHGLAEWWSEHPQVPRRVVVDAAMDAAWLGLRGQLRPRRSRR